MIKKLSMAVLIVLVLYAIFTYRTSSRTRFSEAAKADIPHGIKIVTDKYEGWKDYQIDYVISLDSLAAKHYIQNIEQSPFYYLNGVNNEKKGVWYSTAEGFRFMSDTNRITCNIEFDTMKNIATFTETSN